MSEDGLDDELIALVGEDAPTQHDAPRSHDKRSALLSDLSDDEDAEGEDDVQANPYPLEGIYKDEDDREWLLSMNEVEREDVLSQRRDEMSRKQQQIQLAAMVRSQQAAAGKTRRSSADKAQRRRSDVRRELEDLADPFAESDEEDMFRESEEEEVRPRSTKADKLSELRRKRAERAGKAAHDSDEDARPVRRRRRDLSEESESDYEPTYVPRKVREPTPILAAHSAEPPSLALLNKVRLGRDELERLLFLPNGPDLVRGCFVRCSWGTREHRDGRKEHIYRVHQILRVSEREKYYDVSHDHSGRWMNSYVTFKWGGKEHHVDVRPLSTQSISDSERQRWIAAAGPDAKFPSADAFETKHAQLASALTAPLTEDDIKKILERKRTLRAAAESRGLDIVGGEQEDQHRMNEQAMAQINERNRRQDRERIQEAERRAALLKRKATAPPAPPATTEATAPLATRVSDALASAPSGTGVVPTMDVDLGDF